MNGQETKAYFSLEFRQFLVDNYGFSPELQPLDKLPPNFIDDNLNFLPDKYERWQEEVFRKEYLKPSKI